MRHYLTLAARERAEREAGPWRPLWTGACRAELLDVQLELTLLREDDGGFRLAACAVRLPAFGFHLDDAAWEGEAAEVARNRLAQLYFIRSWLQDLVRTGLEAFASERLSRVSVGS